MDISSTNPPAALAQPAKPGAWIELAGAAALDPAQEARVERWLADLFGDEEDDTAEPAVH